MIGPSGFGQAPKRENEHGQQEFKAGVEVMIADKYLCDYITEARRYLKGRTGVVEEQHPKNGNVLVRWLKKGNRGSERVEWQRSKELIIVKDSEA